MGVHSALGAEGVEQGVGRLAVPAEPGQRLGPPGGDEMRLVLEPVVVEPAGHPIERREGAVELLQR